ncbi:hypothetical protein ACL02T_01190 [Pseudonocardia sp. RS010]|uniref:hypothetical protein n=1 Tax=Pseudonocardia sp. RS010 TaxID=3385979 RepID=UPI00399FF4CB
MATFPSGVTIVTSSDAEGRWRGFPRFIAFAREGAGIPAQPGARHPAARWAPAAPLSAPSVMWADVSFTYSMGRVIRDHLAEA